MGHHRLHAAARASTTRRTRNGALVRDAQGRATVDAHRRRAPARGRESPLRLGAARAARARGAARSRWAASCARTTGTTSARCSRASGAAARHGARRVAYYDYHPRTLAAGAVRARGVGRCAPALRVTADLAWRHQGYAMRDDRFDGIAFDQRYDFALPRLALCLAARASAGRRSRRGRCASREPAFRDLYDAEGAGTVPLYRVHRRGRRHLRATRSSGPSTCSDFELGGAWRGRARRADARTSTAWTSATSWSTRASSTPTSATRSSATPRSRCTRASSWPAHARRARRRGRALELDANATLVGQPLRRTTPSTTARRPRTTCSYDGKPIGFSPARMANAGARALVARAVRGARGAVRRPHLRGQHRQRRQPASRRARCSNAVLGRGARRGRRERRADAARASTCATSATRPAATWTTTRTARWCPC